MIPQSTNQITGRFLKDYVAAAEQFNFEGKVLDAREYGSGNINRTFLVAADSKAVTQAILQSINHQVFPEPKLISENIRVYTEHVHERMMHEEFDSSRRWELPRIIPTKQGNDYYICADGSFWRATSFIQASKYYEKIKDSEHAKEAGYALGRFHCLVTDLDHRRLHDTLRGFHILPQYLQHYDKVLSQNECDKEPRALIFCKRFIEERREAANILENAKRQGKLILRTIHGDPKISNILFDNKTDRAICIIDLDTVKPGLIHYDIGDCLRSCCNLAGEETQKPETAHFDIALCEAILEGFFSIAQSFLNENDYAYVYDSIRLLAFELGLRFFTDFLESDVYYKTKYQGHNLTRALVQFKLTESIESQKEDIENIIMDLEKRRTH